MIELNWPAMVRSRMLCAILLLALLSVPANTRSAVAWEAAHGGGTNSGFVDVVTAPAGRGSVSVPDLGTIAPGAGPVTGPDGTVYIGTMEGWLIALHADGRPFWRRDITPAGQAILASPAVGTDGSIYVIGVKQYRDHRVDPPRKRYETRLHRFYPGGGYTGSTLFPEDWDGAFTDAAPNIWRMQGSEFVIVPARYPNRLTGGYEVHLFGFPTAGGPVIDMVVSTFVPTVTGGAGLKGWQIPACMVPVFGLPACFPFGFSLRVGDPVVPPMPGVAIFTFAGGGAPHIVLSDHLHGLRGYTLSRGSNAFVPTFHVEDERRLMRSAPMVLPDGHTVIGQQTMTSDSSYGDKGAAFFTGPNMNPIPAVSTLGPVFAAPTRTVNGLTVLVEAFHGLAVLRNGTLVSRASLGGVSIASVAASRTHVFAASGSAFVTYDAAAQVPLMTFNWVGGGLWPPTIGPQGHVYAIASNILFVFPPPVRSPLDDVVGGAGGGIMAPEEAATEPATPPSANPPVGTKMRFENPEGPNGLRLHACTEVGGDDCGREVATPFCQQQGWAKSGKYDVDNKKVKAETLAGAACTRDRCKVFDYIECVN